eukprot:jgi/Bigna1/133173/aug1.20_g7881
MSIPNPLAPSARQANYTAIIQWPWKLILGTAHIINPGNENLSGWYTIEKYTFIPPPQNQLGAAVLLFDLEHDEEERRNVASAHPDIVAAMTDRVYSKWLAEANGYRPPQLNLPMPSLNPRRHNWTWVPFML